MKKLLFLVSLYVLNTWASIDPLTCQNSKSPLFKNVSPHDVLQMQLITDFADINKYKNDEYPRTGVLQYKDANGDKVTMPVQVIPRGNSRRDYCAMVPLTIRFDQEELLTKLKERSSSLDIYSDYLAYADYVQQNADQYSDDFKGTKQTHNIFRKLGKKIKIVTHCGNSNKHFKNQWKLSAETDAEHTLRVVQEHYIYNLLNTLTSASLKTRLAIISYLNPQGELIYKRIAMFLEPKKALAKRCGLSKNKNYDERGYWKYVSINQFAEVQATLYNLFFMQTDYHISEHNMFFLYAPNQKYPIPYDYDLSGVIRPDFTGHHTKKIKKYQLDLDTLALKYPETISYLLKHMLQQQDEMNSILEGMVINQKSELGRHTTDEMFEWFDTYMQVIAEKLIELVNKE